MNVTECLSQAAEGASKRHEYQAKVQVPTADGSTHELIFVVTPAIGRQTLGDTIGKPQEPSNEKENVQSHGFVIAKYMLDSCN